MLDAKKGSNSIKLASKGAVWPNFCYITYMLYYLQNCYI